MTVCGWCGVRVSGVRVRVRVSGVRVRVTSFSTDITHAATVEEKKVGEQKVSVLVLVLVLEAGSSPIFGNASDTKRRARQRKYAGA